MMLHETDTPTLKKDMRSKAVISTDLASLNRYKAEKQRRDSIEDLKNRMEVVEVQMSQMIVQTGKLNTTIEDLIQTLVRMTS